MSKKAIEQIKAMLPKVHRPCAAGIKYFKQHCGAESTRLARDGRRYCEHHYNRLPAEVKYHLNP
jgi:hypothetical protein